MNPAALRANVAGLPNGATVIVNVDAFDERNLDQGRLRQQSTGRRLAGRLHGLRGADDLDHHRGLEGRRGQAPGRRAFEELLRPGPDQLALHPPDRGHHRVDPPEVLRRAPGDGGQPPGLQGRLPLRRDRRAVRVVLRGEAGRRWSPASTSTSPATPPRPGASSPPPPRAGSRSSSAPTRSRPASDILHELSKHKQFGVRTFQAEDEISGIGAALGRGLRRRARRDHHLGPGHRPQVGDHGAGHQPRAPPAGHRHPARRPVHRAADQDRAGRPPPRHVRPPRRGAAAHRGGQDAVALLRGHDRGGAPGGQVPHPGDAAVRRLPGQRDRAVAAARPGRPARHRSRIRHPGQPHRRRRHRGLLALRPGRRDPGPALGATRSGRARAPDRRPREGGRRRERGLRRPEPRADDPPPGGQGRGHRRRHPAHRGRRPGGCRAPGGRLGLHLRRHRRRGAGGSGPAATRWPMPTSSTSTRSPPISARCSAATGRCSCPRSTSAS